MAVYRCLHTTQVINYVIGTKYINKNHTSLLILLVADYKEYE